MGKKRYDQLFLLVGLVAALFVLVAQNPDLSGEVIRYSISGKSCHVYTVKGDGTSVEGGEIHCAPNTASIDGNHRPVLRSVFGSCTPEPRICRPSMDNLCSDVSCRSNKNAGQWVIGMNGKTAWHSSWDYGDNPNTLVDESKGLRSEQWYVPDETTYCRCG